MNIYIKLLRLSECQHIHQNIKSMPEVNNSTLGKSSIIGKILLHIGNWLKQGVGKQVWFVPHTAAWKVYIVIYFS